MQSDLDLLIISVGENVQFDLLKLCENPFVNFILDLTSLHIIWVLNLDWDVANWELKMNFQLFRVHKHKLWSDSWLIVILTSFRVRQLMLFNKSPQERLTWLQILKFYLYLASLSWFDLDHIVY